MHHDPRRQDLGGSDDQGPPATVVAVCSPHDAAVWADHPDILHLVIAPGSEAGADVTLHAWLKALSPEMEDKVRRFGRAAPERPFDLEVGGDGEPHPTFWARCTHVEHLQAHRAVPPA